MKKLFKNWVLKPEIFCKYCSTVEPHNCYIRNSYDHDQVILSEELVLSVCNSCDGKQVFFAKDFKELSVAEEGEFTCKILSKNRVVVGDVLYIPDESKLGTVKSIIRINPEADNTAIDETYTMVYEDGEEEKIIVPIYNISGEAAVRKYKLLPYQIGNAKIGDYIYHIIRKKAALIVGIVHDKVDKLILRLDDDTILVTVRSESESQPDNKYLSKKIVKVLKQYSKDPNIPLNSKDLKIKVSQRIAFVSGVSHSLVEKELIHKLVADVAGIKGVICTVEIHPEVEVSDKELTSDIHKTLFNEKFGVFGVSIDVEEKAATINGYIKESNIRKDIFNSIIRIPGLKDLKLNLEENYTESFHEMEKSRRIVETLKKSGGRESKIIVSTIRGITYLNGEVSSRFRKMYISTLLMFEGNVENNLRITDVLESESYVKIG